MTPWGGLGDYDPLAVEDYDLLLPSRLCTFDLYVTCDLLSTLSPTPLSHKLLKLSFFLTHFVSHGLGALTPVSSALKTYYYDSRTEYFKLDSWTILTAFSKARFLSARPPY